MKDKRLLSSALVILLSVLMLSLGDLMEIIPLFAPAVASPFFPFFHEIHDLLALGIALYAAYKYHTRLGVAAVLLFYAAHTPYFIAYFPQEAPELLRNLFSGFVALFGIWLVNRLHKTGKLLRQSQEHLQLQVERMPIGLIVWDTDFRVQSWNPAAEGMFGFTAKEASGKHPYDLIVPKEAQPYVDTIWRRLLEGDMTAHSVNDNVTKDGRTIICDWLNTPLRGDDGHVAGVLSMVQDITERKRAEKQITHLNSLLRMLRDVNQLITREKDRESLIQQSCDLMVQRKGYEKAWILLLDESKNFVTVASSGLGEKAPAFLKQLETGNYPVCLRGLLAQEQAFIAYDQPGKQHQGCVLADEHSRQGVFRCRLEYEGKLYGVLGVTLPSGAVSDQEEQGLFLELCGDIAFALANIESEEKRRQAEEALRASEERYRTLVENALVGVFRTNLKGDILYINDALVSMFGFDSAEEMIASGAVVRYKNPSDRAILLKELTEKGKVNSFELELLTKTGEIKNVIINAVLQGDTLSGMLLDITEHKKTEAQLMVTDRLASIGELTAGIAHELNNPLTGVIGFSELLLEKDVPADIKKDLMVINQEAKRTAEVIKNLLTFARKHPQEKQAVNINSAINTVLGIRAYEEKVNNIQVNTYLAADLPEVMADGFQLQQVFLNIIINAEYFMIEAHRGGMLTITTEMLGDIIRISFADDGPGIAPENLRYIFTPFFTTKEVGKGTGLGLSICYGIVTAHGGRVYAESQLGEGATFIVELPISP